MRPLRGPRRIPRDMLDLVWTGLILAGGRSLRMGRDKTALKLGGMTLLARAVDRVRQAGGEPLVLGPPRSHAEVSGSRQIDENDRASGGRGGPLFALRRGLQECGTRLALALACDVPLVPVPLLRFLVEEAERYDAVVPRAAGELQVLTAAYTISCLEAIDRKLHSGGRAVHNLLSCVRTRVVEADELLAFGGEGVFLNINTPEDLARAEPLVGGRESPDP